MTGPESKLRDRCRRYLDETYGGDVWHHKMHGSVFNQTGIPDLLICYLGRWFLVEFKSPGKKPTRKQWFMANRIRRAGGLVATIDNYDDFLTFCNAHF